MDENKHLARLLMLFSMKIERAGWISMNKQDDWPGTRNEFISRCTGVDLDTVRGIAYDVFMVLDQREQNEWNH